VGAILFVVCGITKMPLERLVRAIWPYLVWQLAVLFLVTYVPWFCMWLPRLLGYGF
jgi:TRAP-type C4-dicarboxylate transport system permease large subunit